MPPKWTNVIEVCKYFFRQHCTFLYMHTAEIKASTTKSNYEDLESLPTILIYAGTGGGALAPPQKNIWQISQPYSN